MSYHHFTIDEREKIPIYSRIYLDLTEIQGLCYAVFEESTIGRSVTKEEE
ncbi:hypothetical protein ACVR1G_01085 [Streptococcus dentasini]